MGVDSDILGLVLACLAIGCVIGACLTAVLTRPLASEQIQAEIDTAFKVGWHARNSQLAGLPEIDKPMRKERRAAD